MNKLDFYLDMAKKIRSPLIVPKMWNYLKYKTLKRNPVVKCYTPAMAVMFLINRCNLSCNCCGFVNEGLFKGPRQEMSLEIIKEAFSHKLLKNCLVVDLIGGEPLLCKDFVPIVKFLSGRGYLTMTSTNGLLLPNKIKEIKSAGITRINVSIYPENIKILKDSLPWINKVYQVHTSGVLTKELLENNQQYLFDILDHSINSGCKSLRFYMGDQLSKKQKLDEFVNVDFSVYREFKENVTKKYKKFVFWPQALSDSREKRCAYLWQAVYILADGLMRICCGTMECIKNVNFFSNSFEEIYNGEHMVEMRKNLLNNSIPPLEICKHCNRLTDTGF
jgi:organic radical activating enzyme